VNGRRVLRMRAIGRRRDRTMSIPDKCKCAAGVAMVCLKVMAGSGKCYVVRWGCGELGAEFKKMMRALARMRMGTHRADGGA